MKILHHRRQQHLYGCLYHALYALSGDEGWLAHVDDLSDPRWLARLRAAGMTVRTYFADLMTESVTPPAFWDVLRANIPAQGEGEEATTHLPLLVTVEGAGGRRHLVSLLLPVAGRDDVVVSDSARDDVMVLTYADFLAGGYARASEVQQLISGDVEAHAYESGAEYLSPADPGLYAM